MIVYGDEVIAWVTQKLGVPRYAYGLGARAVGMTRNGELSAGVVYGPFNGHNVHAHIASDGSKRWMTRDFLYEIFAVPFNQLQAKRLTATTDSNNKAAIQFLTRLGFKLYGCLPESSNDGGDLLIYQMGRDEWLASL